MPCRPSCATYLLCTHTFLPSLRPKVSAAGESRDDGGMATLSPIEADMAEQGHKSRAAAARLERALGSTPVTEGKKEVDDGMQTTGMMPLRCTVNGR